VRTVNLRTVPGMPVDFAGFGNGWVKMSVVDPETEQALISDEVLSGDYFLLDRSNNFASGDNLLASPGANTPPDLCQLWTLRFFNGGDFDGGTDLVFYVPGNPEDGEPVVIGQVYDESGTPLQEIRLSNPGSVFEVNTGDLELNTSFGAIEWRFRDRLTGHISGVFKASGKFSVGLPAICQDPS
jgi:hypothetical protein